MVHPEITSIITGPDTVEQSDETLVTVGWSLEREERARLDALSQYPTPMRIALDHHRHSERKLMS